MTWTHADLASRCGKAQAQSDGSFKALCPAHDDRVQSLHISQSAAGDTLVRCQAGCAQEIVWRKCVEIMGGAGKPAKPTTPAKPKASCVLPAPAEITDLSQIKHREFGTPTIVYEYRDQSGALHFYNCRFEFEPRHDEYGSKQHRPYTFMSSDKWMFSAPEKGRRIPYRLNHLLPGGAVIIHEGEKAADAGAVLSPEVSHLGAWGGANNLTYTDWNCIAGRDVWLVPDADPAQDKMPLGHGVAGMEQLKPKLEGLGCQVKFCRNVHDALMSLGVDPATHKGFDAADALTLGWDHDKFVAYLDAAVESAADAGAADPAIDALANFAASIEAVKNKPTTAPFLPLGYSNDVYYYLSRATKQIHRLTPTQHKRATLMSICAQESWWQSYVPMKKSGPDWDNCCTRMMDECHKVGLFDPDNVRGRGAWYDGGKPVIHLGNRLIIEGEERDIMTRPGAYIYELAPTLEGPGMDAMTDAEAGELLSLCKQFSWAHDVNALYLMGWVMLAPICGAIPWRPHVWISGARGTGKSTIMDSFVTPLLGNVVVSVQGDSTEAGIRQILKHDALPVVIDEAESENDRGASRIEAILQMMRQASSDTAARTIKGGATGNAQTYHIRSMFMLGSIGVSINRAADQSRITVLDLVQATNDWRELQTQITRITPETSKRLIARSINMIAVIRHNANVLADSICKITGDQRFSDQYGMLFSGATAMMHGRRLTKAEADAFITTHKTELSAQADTQGRDEVKCLDHLLQAIIRMDRNVNMSVGELINAVVRGNATINQGEAERALMRHGIKARQCEETVFIAQSHSQLAGLFRGTPYQAGWCQFLLRFEGIKRHQSASGKEVCVRFGGSPCRAISVPMSIIEGRVEEPVEKVEDVDF